MGSTDAMRITSVGRGFARHCMYTEAGKFRCFDEGRSIVQTPNQASSSRLRANINCAAHIKVIVLARWLLIVLDCVPVFLASAKGFITQE